MKKWSIGLLALLLSATVALTGCSNNQAAPKETATATEESAPTEEATEEPAADPAASDAQAAPEQEQTTILIAAAASLEYSLAEKLIPMFETAHPDIKVEGSYDASGKLQTQIEEGLGADLFFSAAPKQMNALIDQNLADKDSIVDLLENKIVLIAAADADTSIASFADIVNADTIAVGDPESVPVGEYAKEALTSIGVWDEIQPKISLGTNVTEVLNWVAEGSADVGIVYATDAATTDQVKILAEAPEDSLEKKVIYPVGILTESSNKEAAQAFLDFLSSPEALSVFEEYGFTPNQ